MKGTHTSGIMSNVFLLFKLEAVGNANGVECTLNKGRLSAEVVSYKPEKQNVTNGRTYESVCFHIAPICFHKASMFYIS